MDGINYIQLYLPDIQIVVKVDQRQLPEIFTPIIVKPKPPHYLPFMPFAGSTEADYFERMKGAIRKTKWASQ